MTLVHVETYILNKLILNCFKNYSSQWRGISQNTSRHVAQITPVRLPRRHVRAATLVPLGRPGSNPVTEPEDFDRSRPPDDWRRRICRNLGRGGREKGRRNIFDVSRWNGKRIVSHSALLKSRRWTTIPAPLLNYSVHKGKHFLLQLQLDYILSWFTTEPVVHLLLLKFSMPHWISAADIATNLLIFGKYLASPSFYIHKIFPSRNLLLQLRVRRFGASERT